MREVEYDETFANSEEVAECERKCIQSLKEFIGDNYVVYEKPKGWKYDAVVFNKKTKKSTKVELKMRTANKDVCIGQDKLSKLSDDTFIVQFYPNYVAIVPAKICKTIEPKLVNHYKFSTNSKNVKNEKVDEHLIYVPLIFCSCYHYNQSIIHNSSSLW